MALERELREPSRGKALSMTGASAGPEAAGQLAGKGAGEGCVAAFFTMPAV